MIPETATPEPALGGDVITRHWNMMIVISPIIGPGAKSAILALSVGIFQTKLPSRVQACAELRCCSMA